MKKLILSCLKMNLCVCVRKLVVPDQGSTNFMRSDEHACNVHAKRFLHAHKSIKTPLSSTTMLFKVIFVSENT